MANPSVQQLIDAGISRTHAYDIVAGREEPSLKVAFAIFDKTGEKFGILSDLSDGTIEELRPRAAA